MEDKFCFIHIEKAGGSTIHNWLKYYLPNYLSLNPFYIFTNEKESDFTFQELKYLKVFHPFITGFGSHRVRHNLNYEKLFKGQLKYVTFLRNPISRYLSHFQHQNDVMKNNWTIEQFLNEKRFNNFMCVKICGEEDGEKAFLELKNNFSFVGFVEEFNKSLLMFIKELGNQNLKPYYERVNEGNLTTKISFDDFTDDIKTQIVLNNGEDEKLYNLSKKYFLSMQISNYGVALENDLKDMENKLPSFKYHKLRRNAVRIFKGYNHFFSEPVSHFLGKNKFSNTL